MRNRNSANGRATGSATNGAVDVLHVGDLPPLPSESGARGMAPSTCDRETLADAARSRLDAIPDDVLEQDTIDLRKSINAAHAQFALQVRELERRAIPEVDHRLSTTGWLKRFCNMTASEASGIVKTARALAHMPTVAANALAGSVPARSTQVLAQARDRHPADFVAHEAVFADVATYLSVADLRRAVGHWEQQVDYPGALRDVADRERRRSLYLAEMMDGMGDVRGTLTPELHDLVSTAIDARVSPTFLDADDRRTPAQRRADALGDVCRFYLDHNEDSVTSGGEKPHVTVTVDWDTLAGRARQLPEIADTPVSPETIRRITCDAGIVPMVLGSDSQPLDIGRRTRTIPVSIRRALEHRDLSCTWVGCNAPISWCDAHHITHWADGGRTDLDNLTLLCRKHHTATHDGQKPPADP